MAYDPQDAGKARTANSTGSLFGSGPMDPERKPIPSPPPALSSGLTPTTSGTSAAAGEKASRSASGDCARVLEYIRKKGTATTDEIEAGLDMAHQTASSRVYDLAGKNRRRPDLLAIVETGKTRKTRRGSSAAVYRAFMEDEIVAARRRLAEKNATTGNLPGLSSVEVAKGIAALGAPTAKAVEALESLGVRREPAPPIRFSAAFLDWIERAGLYELAHYRDQVDIRIRSLEEGPTPDPAPRLDTIDQARLHDNAAEFQSMLDSSWADLISFVDGVEDRPEIQAARTAVALLLGGRLTPPNQGARHGS